MLVALGLAVASATVEPASSTSTVYIIRHGEKTFGGGCLNIQGQERANNIPSVFDGTRFLKPAQLFANKYYGAATTAGVKTANCERCFLTIQPIAQFLSIPLDFDHGYPTALGGNQGAANAIKAAALKQGVVLVAWEHYNIQFLTADLGVDKSKIPEWSGDDYDSIYVLTFDSSGTLSSFEAKAQGYVPQSTTCPPHYVPPGAAPAPPPTPVPPGKQWECHDGYQSTNSMNLTDDDLKYVGSKLSACENECNARGCPVVVWHASDEHCHVLSGSVSHEDFVSSLQKAADYTACMLVPKPGGLNQSLSVVEAVHV